MQHNPKDQHRLAKETGKEQEPLLKSDDTSSHSKPPPEEDEGGLRTAFAWVVYVSSPSPITNFLRPS